MAFALIIIVAIIFIKYKPAYEVTISGEEVGYVIDNEEFNNVINNNLLKSDDSKVAFITIKDMPSYEFKLINRIQDTNENEIISKLQDEAITTYRLYAIVLDGETKSYVDTIEEAEEVVDTIKKDYENDLELDLQIVEKYTENLNSLEEDTIEVATAALDNILNEKVIELNTPEVNGVKLYETPVTGRITSRFGSISSVRSSAHKGLDIAATTGTDIKVIASGTVVYAGWENLFGNIVKVSHGNGVETWYAHCSKLYVSTGDEVNVGDVISAVGSTGNSTGPHLHLQIMVNGEPVDPQDYLYK